MKSSIKKPLKYKDVTFTNIQTNANKQYNLGAGTQFCPSDAILLNVSILSVSTGAGPFSIELGTSPSQSIWLTATAANHTIANLQLRGFYLES